MLVVLNGTAFDATAGRSYVTYSNSLGSGSCNINSQQLMQMADGPRLMFFWEISYPQHLEDGYGDDGYELGADYPYTSLSLPG